jgi:hypothetical protein
MELELDRKSEPCIHAFAHMHAFILPALVHERLCGQHRETKPDELTQQSNVFLTSLILF